MSECAQGTDSPRPSEPSTGEVFPLDSPHRILAVDAVFNATHYWANRQPAVPVGRTRGAQAELMDRLNVFLKFVVRKDQEPVDRDSHDTK